MFFYRFVRSLWGLAPKCEYRMNKLERNMKLFSCDSSMRAQTRVCIMGKLYRNYFSMDKRYVWYCFTNFVDDLLSGDFLVFNIIKVSSDFARDRIWKFRKSFRGNEFQGGRNFRNRIRRFRVLREHCSSRDPVEIELNEKGYPKFRRNDFVEFHSVASSPRFSKFRSVSRNVYNSFFNHRLREPLTKYR